MGLDSMFTQAELRGDLQTDTYGLQFVPIDYQDSHAAAHLPFEFAGLGRERDRHEANAGCVCLIQSLGQAAPVKLGGAEQFERARCTAPFRQVRTFEKYHAWVHGA